jgi:hypothetical protein
MVSPMCYLEYEKTFLDIWSTWIGLVGGVEDVYFKMERFKAGLDPYFQYEVHMKYPRSFHDLLRVCQSYDQQLKKLLFGEAYGVSASYTINPSYNNCGSVMSQQPAYLQCPIQQVPSYHYSNFWSYNDVYEGDSRDNEEEVMNVESPHLVHEDNHDIKNDDVKDESKEIVMRSDVMDGDANVHHVEDIIDTTSDMVVDDEYVQDEMEDMTKEVVDGEVPTTKLQDEEGNLEVIAGDWLLEINACKEALVSAKLQCMKVFVHDLCFGFALSSNKVMWASTLQQQFDQEPRDLLVMHDWSIINLSPSKDPPQLIKCIKEKESSIDIGKQEEESITIDEYSWDRENKSFHMVSKEEEEVIEEKSIITLKGKKKMISNDVQGEEDLRFISLFFKFTKLFINEYSQIRVEGIKHHIKLENLKFVSLIVVVPKEKDVNFQSLNDSTKRDLFLLPFRDEILDEMVIHKKQGNVENVVCQEESHVDEAKIDIIQNMTILTSLEALKVFVQKVRSLERFIHMLTCLLLSRVMYHIDLLLFGKLMKIY